MFEHVVVGVRGEESGRDAIALGKELVSAEGKLTLLHVYVVPSKPAADSGAVGDAAKRRYVLERLTALATEFGVDAQESWVEARSVRHGLHGFALDEQADLLVVGASHYDEVARDLIGDDTRVLLEDAPCVVAVAPLGYSARVGEVRRIGVAYDGSAGSEQALMLARKLAAERHALLSAFEAVGASPDRDPWDIAAEFAKPVEQARRRIAALGGLEADAGFGDAVEELSRFGESVDLLVVGSHLYRPIERGLESSTPQRLADEVSCPLLVLPSAARADPD
jgi:nucleotide-binding universal stress UspA family protein